MNENEISQYMKSISKNLYQLIYQYEGNIRLFR
jgi:hypothetical protein